MKKILFICDTKNFSSGAFQFIKSLYQTEPFLLAGAFFHSANYDVLMPTNYIFDADPLIAYTDADIKAVKDSIQKFEQKCQQSGIEYRVHEESDEYKIEDLVKESRFSDVIVLSEELFFSQVNDEQPNTYMQEVLIKSECPLLIIPEKYIAPTQVIVAYDGKKQSMFALKEFCYLFPEYAKYPVTILLVQKDSSKNEIPNMRYLEEKFLVSHIKSIFFIARYFGEKSYPETIYPCIVNL